MPEIGHFASPGLSIRGHLRQRCEWCGAVLTDYDLSRVAVQDNPDGSPGEPPAGFPAGAIVVVDDHVGFRSSHVIEPEPDPDAPGMHKIPEDVTTCFDIDPDITGGDASS